MQSEYQLDIDPNQMCRACLARDCVLRTLFCNEIVDGDVVAMPSVFETATELKAEKSDGLPENVCAECRTKLIESFLLKRKCMKSNGLLRKLLNVPESESKSEEKLIKETERRDASTMVELTDIPEVEVDHYEVIAEENLVDEESMIEIKVPDDLRESFEPTASTSQDEDYDELNDETDDPLNEEDEEEEAYCDYEVIEIEDDEANPKMTASTNRMRMSMQKRECFICNVKVSLRTYKDHMAVHEEILPIVLSSAIYFRCGKCRSVFSTATNLEAHLETDHDCFALTDETNSAECTDYQFLDDWNIKNVEQFRLFSCTKVAVDCLQCDICKHMGESSSAMFDHFNETHFADGAELVEDLDFTESQLLAHSCGECDKYFTNVREIVNHVYFHQTKFYCPFAECNACYDKFLSLNRHISRQHLVDATHECQHCSQNFDDYNSLKAHLRFKCQERKLKCSFCSKRFFQKQTKKMHERIHNNVKPHQCNVCEKSFVQSNDLKNHLRIHSGERPFECSICTKSFKTIGNRADHMETHALEKLFECEHCQQKFKSARILKGHKVLHKEKNFKCEICDKRFSRRYHVKSHMKVHPKAS